MTLTATNWTNVTNVGALLRVANDNTSGWFYTGILYMVSIIIIITLAPFGIEAGVLAGAFAGIAIGILLVYLGLVSITSVGVFVGIMFLWFLYLTYSNKYDQ